MLTIPAKSICPETGKISVAIKLKRFEEREFDNEQDANEYIQSTKKSLIRFEFEKFVNHKVVLSKFSGYYKRTDQFKALENMLKLNDWMSRNPLDKICAWVSNNNVESDMRKILPSPNNNSFKSSEEFVTRFIAFCKEEHGVIKSQAA